MLVRHSALLALRHCFENSDNVRVGAFLAATVLDEAVPIECRFAAYDSLLRIRRGPAAILRGPTLDFDSVDWEYVQESLDTSRSAVPVDPLAPFVAGLPDSRAIALRHEFQGLDAYERGEYDLAVHWFSEALRIWPDAGASWLARGKAFIELGRLEEAISDLTHYIEMKGNMVETFRERARAYRLQGNERLAAEDERTAMELDIQRRGNKVEAFRERARAYRLQGNDGLADQDERAAMELERLPG
jgi:tetratricopeptide (TPR) repeat protein